MNIVEHAVKYAAEKHKGQFRKTGNRPFVCHVIEVMAILKSFGYEEDYILAAAALHDVIEDCEVSREELQMVFGERVANIVQELSNPTGDNDLTSEERNRINTEHLSKAKEFATFRIKCADRIANLREMDWYGNRRWCESFTKRTRLYLLPLMKKELYNLPIYYALERIVIENENKLAFREYL